MHYVPSALDFLSLLQNSGRSQSSRSSSKRKHSTKSFPRKWLTAAQSSSIGFRTPWFSRAFRSSGVHAAGCFSWAFAGKWHENDALKPSESIWFLLVLWCPMTLGDPTIPDCPYWDIRASYAQRLGSVTSSSSSFPQRNFTVRLRSWGHGVWEAHRWAFLSITPQPHSSRHFHKPNGRCKAVGHWQA